MIGLSLQSIGGVSRSGTKYYYPISSFENLVHNGHVDSLPAHLTLYKE
jgi:hypothetical protein